MTELKELVGKVLTAVRNVDDEEIIFETACGKTFKLFHAQDCCESVSVESIVGDLDDLVGTPILLAEEVTNAVEPAERPWADDSYSWTFYKLATIKGYVDIRWFGTSNGYYSESVDFGEVIANRR